MKTLLFPAFVVCSPPTPYSPTPDPEPTTLPDDDPPCLQVSLTNTTIERKHADMESKYRRHIVITVQSEDGSPNSGKTVTQSLIAQSLAARGHSVWVSEEGNDPRDLIRFLPAADPRDNEPMDIEVRVSRAPAAPSPRAARAHF